MIQYIDYWPLLTAVVVVMCLVIFLIYTKRKGEGGVEIAMLVLAFLFIFGAIISTELYNINKVADVAGNAQSFQDGESVKNHHHHHHHHFKKMKTIGRIKND